MTNEFDRPFQIRDKGGKWEVVAIIEGVFQAYIDCDTQGQAEAVADTRILYGYSMTGQKCEVERVNRALKALELAGFGQGTLFYRKLDRYRERLSPNG